MAQLTYEERAAKFETLKGRILKSVTTDGSDEIRFEDSNGQIFLMEHNQDCCESVHIEDIAGDLQDLVDSEILRAEENSSEDVDTFSEPDNGAESETWTFYRIQTAKGLVVIRWYGSSNGYYSEHVDFQRVK